jgi:hypothetical protein
MPAFAGHTVSSKVHRPEIRALSRDPREVLAVKESQTLVWKKSSSGCPMQRQMPIKGRSSKGSSSLRNKTFSRSLVPVVSVMQATDTRE